MLMLATVTISSHSHNTLICCLSGGNISNIPSIMIVDCQEKGPDARVTFETFLPMLQDVSSKPIRDTVDDFVEVRTGQRVWGDYWTLYVIIRDWSILTRRATVWSLLWSSGISSLGWARRWARRRWSSSSTARKTRRWARSGWWRENEIEFSIAGKHQLWGVRQDGFGPVKWHQQAIVFTNAF